MSDAMDLPGVIQRFLDGAPGSVLALHDRLIADGMAGTYAKYLRGAGPEAIATFFKELSRADMDWVSRHRAALLGDVTQVVPRDLTPVEPAVIPDAERAEFERVGQQSLAAGEWAVLVLAGGASTRFYAEAHAHPRARELVSRLGFEPPKGLFPVAPVSGRSFLELFAAETLAAGVESGRMPYFILLVSDVTEPAIQQWLRTSDVWGFPRDFGIVLRQAVRPRLDLEGDLVAHPDGRLSWTGDGHGGAFRALLERGEDGRSVVESLRDQGVRGVVLHNVDNAAARALDPARVGFHVATRAAMTLSVVPRARLDEKVGIVAFNLATGRIEVVEYSVCPRALSEAAGPDGLPRFRLAHICTNLVSLDAIRADLPLTLYRGKEVRVGDRVVRASSLEMLNQHLSGLLDARDVRVLLLDRDGYFLPTKTLSGPDSHETTVAALAARGRRRLRDAGAVVADAAVVEVAPCLADLAGAGVGRGWIVGPRAQVFLGVRHGVGGAPPFSEGLEVGDGSWLRVEAEHPYGRVRVDDRTRGVTEDPSTAGRVRVGRGVRLVPGAGLDVVLSGDAALVIEDGARVAGRIEASVPPGEEWTIARDGTVRRGPRE